MDFQTNYSLGTLSQPRPWPSAQVPALSEADAVRGVLDDCFEQVVCIVDEPAPPPPPSVPRPPRAVGLLLKALLGEQGPTVRVISCTDSDPASSCVIILLRA